MTCASPNRVGPSPGGAEQRIWVSFSTVEWMEMGLYEMDCDLRLLWCPAFLVPPSGREMALQHWVTTSDGHREHPPGSIYIQGPQALETLRVTVPYTMDLRLLCFDPRRLPRRNIEPVPWTRLHFETSRRMARARVD